MDRRYGRYQVIWAQGWDCEAEEIVGSGRNLYDSASLLQAQIMAGRLSMTAGDLYGEGIVTITDSRDGGKRIGGVLRAKPLPVMV